MYQKIYIILKIIWKLIKDIFTAIGVFIAFTYIFSGFGLLLLPSAISTMMCSTNTSASITGGVLSALIVGSWIMFTVRWFKRRIKELKEESYFKVY